MLKVILDYFWIPSGSWAMKHWSHSLFNKNIPDLVIEGMFNFGEIDKESVLITASEENGDQDFVYSSSAVVYLPFCSHCLREVVACSSELSKYYTISFLRKDQLDEHTLWKSTNTISPDSMQGWLGKAIDQEEKYCTINAQEISIGADHAHVTTESVRNIFKRIDRVNEVRMIKLTALRKFHPNYDKSGMQPETPTLGIDKGGYIGLIDPSRVKIVSRSTSPSDSLSVDAKVALANGRKAKRSKRRASSSLTNENESGEDTTARVAHDPAKTQTLKRLGITGLNTAVKATPSNHTTDSNAAEAGDQALKVTSSSEKGLLNFFDSVHYSVTSESPDSPCLPCTSPLSKKRAIAEGEDKGSGSRQVKGEAALTRRSKRTSIQTKHIPNPPPTNIIKDDIAEGDDKGSDSSQVKGEAALKRRRKRLSIQTNDITNPLLTNKITSSAKREVATSTQSSKGEITAPRNPNLLVTLIELLENEDTSILAWLPNGDAFIVKDNDRFEADILPRYFNLGQVRICL